MATVIHKPPLHVIGLTVRALWVAAALVGLNGCQALTNPVAQGVPVNRLPPEARGRSREGLKPIPLNTLRRDKPEVYRLESGDILGVYIEGILGERNQLPPVRMSEQGTPAMGYPIPVREDGTVALPVIEPVRVQGMSLPEAQEAIRQAYTVKKQVLQPGRERIIVTLLHPRHYQVLVIRQDSPAGSGPYANISLAPGIGAPGSTEFLGPGKRGTGTSLDLPAYENDVLNALTRTGGLPGLDAKNEVTILRGGARRARGGACPTLDALSGDVSDGSVVRIPLRLPPGTPVPFRPEDVILNDGDIVSIESREAEVFYTAGLAYPGQWPLPRDYDLDIVEALLLVRAPIINGLQSANNFSGQISTLGVGTPNPTRVNVLRQVSGCGQVNILVDLNKALRDPRERVLVQAGDIIVFQETSEQAVTRYVTTSFFKLNFIGTILRRRDAIATTTITTP